MSAERDEWERGLTPAHALADLLDRSRRQGHTRALMRAVGLLGEPVTVLAHDAGYAAVLRQEAAPNVTVGHVGLFRNHVGDTGPMVIDLHTVSSVLFDVVRAATGYALDVGRLERGATRRSGIIKALRRENERLELRYDCLRLMAHEQSWHAFTEHMRVLGGEG